MPKARIPPLVRFYRQTKRDGDCLIWTGRAQKRRPNYSVAHFKAGTLAKDPPVAAHRWIYEQLVGPIPPGYDIDHVKSRGCKSSLCVEIAHLEAVTPEENQRRRRPTVCKSGRHDLTDLDNVMWTKKGTWAGCKPCHNEKSRDRHRQKAAERKEEDRKNGRAPYVPWHLDVCRSGRHDLTDSSNIRWGKDGKRIGCLPCSVEKKKASDAAKWQRKKLQRGQG